MVSNTNMNQQKKILITGAKGMLGWALTKELSSFHKLIGIDIADADITNENQIKEEIFKIHPEIVIHTAAYTAVDSCEQNKQLAHEVNAIGTENVARACHLCNAKLIYISTDFVFDGTKNSPYTENDTPNPINIYGKSKLEGEKQIQATLSNYLIIRSSWLYGPKGVNFVTTILDIAKDQNEIKVVNDQTGSPTYTIDLARAINIFIRKDIKGTVNYTNTGICSWFDFAKEIIDISKSSSIVLPISTSESKRPARRPQYSALSTNKLESITKTKQRNWKEAVKEYITVQNTIEV